MKRANSLRSLQALTRSLHFSKPPFSLTTTRQNHQSNSENERPEAEAEQVKKINELLPRLCESNHLHEAIRLTDTLLLTNPPLESISNSIHVLVDRLSEEPTMTQSMSLLNRLKHSSSAPSSSLFLPHINQLLIASYLDKKKFKEAIKVFRWVSRLDTPPVSDTDMGILGRMVVQGLCENHKTLDALVIVKKMVEDGVVVVGDEIREWVYRSLLWEARVKEAKDLHRALVPHHDLDLDNKSRALGLLDTIIQDWTQ